MTTLDTAVAFAKRVEDAAAEREPIEWRRVLIALLTLVPFVVGQVAGWTVRALMWTVAATAEGYREARNAPVRERTSPPRVSTGRGV